MVKCPLRRRINHIRDNRVTTVFEGLGLILSDAVRILLTRTANQGMLRLELVTNSV